MKTVVKYILLLGVIIMVLSTLSFQAIAGKKEGPGEYHSTFEELEKKYDAHLGVFGIDTESNEVISFNENNRFAFASTFKALAGGFVLRDYTWNELNENVMIHPEDIVDYSPITEKYVGVGMPLKDIVAAAMDYSDNTAGNFLFKYLDGPKGFQGKLEKLGDFVTDSTRYETELNEATPGDIRDTSTPKAIAQDLKEIALGEQLSKDKQEFYKKLLLENTTGANLIAAGVPDNVVVGDKTGAAQYGTRNDIAILYPENRKPIVLVVFSNKDDKDAQYQDKLISDTASIVSEYFNL